MYRDNGNRLTYPGRILAGTTADPPFFLNIMNIFQCVIIPITNLIPHIQSVSHLKKIDVNHQGVRCMTID